MSGKGHDEEPREVQRVRDMPAPRKGDGAAGGAVAWIFQWPYRSILAFLLWTRVRPWQLTLLSPVFIAGSGVLILAGQWLAAGGALLVGSLCDVFDGSVARHRGEVKRSGAFMDSVIDRLADALLFACLFWSFAERGQSVEALLSLVTLIVSLGVSYVRAEAEAAGVTLTEGLFQRTERMIAMMLGLVVPHAMLPMLLVLAVLGTFTFVQRSFSALKGA